VDALEEENGALQPLPILSDTEILPVASKTPSLAPYGSAESGIVVEGQETPKNAISSVISEGTAPILKENKEIVRVMAYLAWDEAETLDDLWLAARRAGLRASKSDILRAALRFSAQTSDDLMVLLSQQHTSTLTRHRDSKMRRAKQDPH
jgi:hypothetical protein